MDPYTHRTYFHQDRFLPWTYWSFFFQCRPTYWLSYIFFMDLFSLLDPFSSWICFWHGPSVFVSRNDIQSWTYFQPRRKHRTHTWTNVCPWSDFHHIPNFTHLTHNPTSPFPQSYNTHETIFHMDQFFPWIYSPSGLLHRMDLIPFNLLSYCPPTQRTLPDPPHFIPYKPASPHLPCMPTHLLYPAYSP